MDASNYRRTLVAAAMGLALAASPAYASSVDDATLTAKVKTALMTDSKAPAMNVNVETRNGVVQLNGYVGTDAERKAAEQRARKVEGVKKVENHLEVRKDTRTASGAVSDTTLAMKVKTALAADKQVPANDVVVEVHDGTVQLGGFVPTASARARAAEVARQVDGVKHVDNRVDVRSTDR